MGSHELSGQSSEDKKISELQSHIEHLESENKRLLSEGFKHYKKILEEQAARIKELESTPNVGAIDWEEIEEKIIDILYDGNGTAAGASEIFDYVKTKFKSCLTQRGKEEIPSFEEFQEKCYKDHYKSQQIYDYFKPFLSPHSELRPSDAVKPLSKISDDDAIEVIQLIMFRNNQYPKTDFKIKRFVDTCVVKVNNDWFQETFHIGFEQGSIWCTTNRFGYKINYLPFDFLRSKGYTLFSASNEGEGKNG